MEALRAVEAARTAHSLEDHETFKSLCRQNDLDGEKRHRVLVAADQFGVPALSLLRAMLSAGLDGRIVDEESLNRRMAEHGSRLIAERKSQELRDYQSDRRDGRGGRGRSKFETMVAESCYGA